MKKTIRVVGAMIENEIGEILCALRSKDMSMPNLWEFPGGKIESGETIEDAIVREIDEELDCEIEFKEIFHDHTHEYEKVIVNLIVVKCKLISRTPKATEHAKLMWLSPENLTSLVWAPADIPAVNKIDKSEK
ncbi:(deoxy)nucleoside triphosphate pyrophosphohydrolase [Clostridium gasigenes]|uniref:(deoxy)nucleoside triphosphate pyrophosphohydrolase n=1 Tax=Clostridium gasigenes TaxID=94869 RepID=UPI001C0E6917|nr:(deoxy)nucleoside triphosphate pyrophosphohydrolase [Clostridium gasigenes]MBU3087148.1 (deoxy)nucleoside triphosphate pyrophosphohydrolase [Clostridium gasigenes]MBU3136410.1 (deoxy)nucleoside triphosphate pyrophosphohydrolase [Clostridium gasigenes]